MTHASYLGDLERLWSTRLHTVKEKWENNRVNAHYYEIISPWQCKTLAEELEEKREVQVLDTCCSFQLGFCSGFEESVVEGGGGRTVRRDTSSQENSQVKRGCRLGGSHWYLTCFFYLSLFTLCDSCRYRPFVSDIHFGVLSASLHPWFSLGSVRVSSPHAICWPAANQQEQLQVKTTTEEGVAQIGEMMIEVPNQQDQAVSMSNDSLDHTDSHHFNYNFNLSDNNEALRRGR